MSESLSCGCVARDAWLCASRQNLSGQVSCDCGACHRPAPPLPKESQACDECDPSFGCFDGSAPCSKRPLPKESQDAIRLGLWDAINAYTRACHGRPDKHVYGNGARQEAVVAVEGWVRKAVEAASLPTPAKESQDAEVTDLAAWANGIAEAQDRVDQSPGECNGCGSTSHGEPCRIHAALARARSDGERQGREKGIREVGEALFLAKMDCRGKGLVPTYARAEATVRALLAPPASEEGKK